MIGKLRVFTLCNRCNRRVEPGTELQRTGEYAWLCRACESELGVRTDGRPTRDGGTMMDGRRAELIDRARRIRSDIEQVFIDVEYWNRIHPEHDPIDPDPDGQLGRWAKAIDEMLAREGERGLRLDAPGPDAAGESHGNRGDIA